MQNIQDIKNQLKEKYQNQDFRISDSGVVTVELQSVQFLADEDYILREPNYDYAAREVEWYKSQSLNVNDIPGNTPKIWQQVADVNGDINSNYGWMIWSKENGSQYNNCLWNLVHDMTTRQAVMIYTRPSMQQDWNKNHKHDFCCTNYVHCFLNQTGDTLELSYNVYQRSCDAVFGFNNDLYWHKYVVQQLITDLSAHYKDFNFKTKIIYNCGSLHVYDRHFKYLE